MSTSTDIEDLRLLRDHLVRVTDCSEHGGGLTYHDEIALLERVIYALETR